MLHSALSRLASAAMTLSVLVPAALFVPIGVGQAQDLHDLKSVPGTPTPDGAVPNGWVEAPSIDLGTHLEGEVARGKWTFKNPSDKPQSINSFQPSCTCSKVTVHIGGKMYRIENQPKPHTLYRVSLDEKGVETKEMVEAVPVGAGEAGEIDVEMDLRGVNGTKEASAIVHTTDEKNLVLTLKAKATAAQFFQVVPPEINLNKMNWQEKREFAVRITSPIQKDFAITGLDPLPEKMEVKYRKEMNGDAAVWIVEGTYGPGVDPRAGGGMINFKTDVQNKTVQLRVIAWVEGPLNIRPGGFIPLGRIPAGQGATKEVELEPTDDFDLQVEKIEFSNLTVDPSLVKVSSRKEGKILKLVLEISPDAPKRLVRGDLTVHLNHPAVKVQEFQFNGFVR